MSGRADPRPELLIGEKRIAEALTAAGLHVAHVQTVRLLALRPFDPLRLRRSLTSKRVTLWSDRLADWIRRERARRARISPDPAIPRFVGGRALRAAAGHMSRSALYELTARARDPFPLEGVGTRKPWAYRCAVRDWIEGQDIPYQLAVLLPSRTKAPTHTKQGIKADSEETESEPFTRGTSDEKAA